MSPSDQPHSSHLKLVSKEPNPDEIYTIESFNPDYVKTGSLAVKLRIVNTNHCFQLPVAELVTKKWLNVLSKFDAMKAGLWWSIESNQSLHLLDKVKNFNLLHHKFILVLAALYINIIILSNTIGGKLTVLFGVHFPAVLYAFPLTFILSDILTEVYGYTITKNIIWLGFLSNLITVSAIFLVGLAPSSAYWDYQDSYYHIFHTSYRISLASFLAYIGGEFLNAYILSNLKKLTNGKYMWARIMIASAISDFADSLIFCTIGFILLLPLADILKMIMIQVCFKLTYELLASPLTCKICKYIKANESIDVYDYGVKYNPLRI